MSTCSSSWWLVGADRAPPWAFRPKVVQSWLSLRSRGWGAQSLYGMSICQPPRFTPLQPWHLCCAGRPSLWRQRATGLAYRSVLSLHRARRTTVPPTLHCRYSAPHSLRTQIPAGSSRAIRHVTSAPHAREATALEYMNQYLHRATPPHRHRHRIQSPRRTAAPPPPDPPHSLPR
jgi:hypothetical protein